MALFASSTKKEKKGKAAATHARATKLVDERAHEVIRHPWYTEKALIATERGVYTFAVSDSADKAHIAAAIKEIYGVAPRQIRVVNMPGKRVSKRTRQGKATRASRRKAYVYLNAGDKIEFA